MVVMMMMSRTTFVTLRAKLHTLNSLPPFAFALLALLFAHFLDPFFGQRLPVHALDNFLLSGHAVADADDDAGGDVDSDGHREDDGCDPARAGVVGPAPSEGAEHDLQA